MKCLLFIVLLIYMVVEDANPACNDQGVYGNPNDNSCQTYIFCFRLPDGVFIEKLYSCPNGTLFNPSTKVCKKNYHCIPPTLPTTSTTTTKIPGVSECTAQGKFPEEDDITCTRYIFCYYLPTGKYIQMSYTCPIGTKFDPRLQTCTAKFKCDKTITTVTAASVIPKSFSCTKQGRFPVKNDGTCRSYYYCLYLPYGGYTQQIFVCPNGLKFDPRTQSCSQNYQCLPTTESSSSATTETTSIASSTSSVSLDHNFNCPSIGRFLDETDISCTKYFLCIQLPVGDLGYETFKCPTDEKFDPDLQICSASYECSLDSSTTLNDKATKLTSSNNQKTTSSITTFSLPTSSNSLTTPSTTTTASDDNFTCPRIGRFTDVSDESCKRYFLCTQLPEGDLGSQIFECSNDENFDPILQLCSLTFECSSEDSSTVQTQSTTFSILTTPLVEKTSVTSIYIPTIISEVSTLTSSNKQKTTSSKSSSSNSPTTSFTTTTASEHNFTCPTIGRFTDTSDESCKRYFLCVELPEGDMKSQIFECSNAENFDPILHVCSESYECPQGESSTVQTDSTTFSILTTPLAEKTSDTTIAIPTVIFKVTTADYIEDDTGVVVNDRTSDDGFSSTSGFVTTGNMEHVCETVGRLPDLKDEKCESYFLCVIGPDGSFLSFKYMCEFNELFDPNLKKCSSSYTCHGESDSLSISDSNSTRIPNESSGVSP